MSSKHGVDLARMNRIRKGVAIYLHFPFRGFKKTYRVKACVRPCYPCDDGSSLLFCQSLCTDRVQIDQNSTRFEDDHIIIVSKAGDLTKGVRVLHPVAHDYVEAKLVGSPVHQR